MLLPIWMEVETTKAALVRGSVTKGQVVEQWQFGKWLLWDGEIAGIRLALDSLPLTFVLVLSKLLAAILTVWNAVPTGMARSEHLKAAVDPIREWQEAGAQICFG